MSGQERSAASERRYEVRALIGPCTEKEAELFLETCGSLISDLLGACWSLGPFEEDDDAQP